MAVPSTAEKSQAASSRALSGPDEDGRLAVLVRFRQPSGDVRAAAAQADRVTRLGTKLKYHWPRLGLAATRLSPAEQEALARDPEVLSIEPDRPVRALGLPPLPAWTLGLAPVSSGSTAEYTPHLKMVQAPEVWDADGDGVLDPGAPTGEGVKVCVIDSGIDARHPELQAAYTGLGKDFVDLDDDPADRDASGNWGLGHGTHVAGIIAAQLGSGGVVKEGELPEGGMVGVAPGVTLLVARVLDEQGNGATSDVIAAVKWCQSAGARIVSLSLGATEPSDAERLAFEEAWQAGLLAVAASGNEGSDDPAAQPATMYPAGYSTVMAVGAVRLDGTHPTFSQVGKHLSLVAPGIRVPSTLPLGAAPLKPLEAGGASLRNEVVEFAGTKEVSGPLTLCGLAADQESCADVRACGFVALVDRGGGILFTDKVKNVQAQGARAVVIVNNDEADDDALAFTLGKADSRWPLALAVPTTARAGLLEQVGRNVRLGVKGADYAPQSGTSMATPFVSGVAALVWSKAPGLSNAQVRKLLEDSARNLGDDAGRDDAYGHGLVQAREALRLLESGNF